MENNNNNGRGIFYGVIGVATLVVAIIGATFAYFSASVTQEDVLNVGSTTLNLAIVNEATNYKTDLIPVDTVDAQGTAQTAFYRYPGVDTTSSAGVSHTCLDDLGNDICSVYTFAVQNPSNTTAQTVVGSLTVSANGFSSTAEDATADEIAGNLYYAVFKGAADATKQGVNANQVITSYNVNGTASKTQTVAADNVTTTDAAIGTVVVGRTALNKQGTVHKWPNTTEILLPGEKTFYTVVVWLEETGVNQDYDQTQGFAASITFTSDTGTSGVTGVISAGV